MHTPNISQKIFKININDPIEFFTYDLARFLSSTENLQVKTKTYQKGYLITCLDNEKSWTNYLAMNVSLDIYLYKENDKLYVHIRSNEWLTKLITATLASHLSALFLLTSGIGAVRSLTLPDTIYDYLEIISQGEIKENDLGKVNYCLNCGHANAISDSYCQKCHKPI